MESRITALPKLFIGIDIHKRSWKIHCSTDFFGGKSFSMPSDPEKLRDYVQKHFPDHEVSTAYEAGCCGYSAHRSFVSFGWESLVVNPADIQRKGKERYTKTDRIDARLISRELKDGRLESIIVPDLEREELRSLFRRRNDLVKDLWRIKSLIKMQLPYTESRFQPNLIMITGATNFVIGWMVRSSFLVLPGNVWQVKCVISVLQTRSFVMFPVN